MWGELTRGAAESITLAGYTNYFLWLDQPAYVDALRRKAEMGCRIRFLIGDPEGDVTRQRESIENVALSVFRFDREALVTPHLARGVGHDSPMLRLRRCGDGGLFDRFAEHVEELWERGRGV
ncbi:hypothetical protein [Streptomyces radicis]|uniref:hypothetical protein n=1 Tax=Streptomyces radicis TaxID=1750517 RepID=UPI001E646003|nr:hypothetical protein [Streptomyces radicis]